MRTIIADDERWSLEQFKTDCAGMDGIELVGAFDSPQAAYEYAKQNRVDCAMLDVSMPEMNGIVLGTKLRELYPNIVIVIVTAYEKYGIDALRMHADYFLLKPYDKKDLEYVLRRALLLSAGAKKRIYIQTFGNFDVFVDGKPIVFSSAKAKEMLALMVDRRGGIVTTMDIFTALWEDKAPGDAAYSLCRKVYQRLNENLKAAGIEDLIIRYRKGRAVNSAVFDCDYYEYLKGNPEAVASFNGEYMSNYSWAEETLARLLNV